MQTRAIIILAVVFAALVVAGIITKIMAQKSRDGLKIKGLNRIFNLGITMGLIGFVYLFFAWQGVIMLSGRFWLLLWLIVTVVWLFFILKYLYKDVPSKRAEINQEREFKKYIP